MTCMLNYSCTLLLDFPLQIYTGNSIRILFGEHFLHALNEHQRCNSTNINMQVYMYAKGNFSSNKIPQTFKQIRN